MKREMASVMSTESLAENIYSIRLKTDIAGKSKAGQFVLVFPNDTSRLLGRPICVCEADGNKKELRIVFRISGEGTKEFSGLKTGDTVNIEGPLGNGYDIGIAKGKKVLLIGGGVGAPSLLQLANELKDSGPESITAVLGYRDDSLKTFLSDDFRSSCDRVIIATDDGSSGIHGNVVDAVKAEDPEADLIYSCGPLPMLKAVSDYASDKGIEAYISLEERMACGVGVCLGCVVETVEKDEHSQVNNARICKEGPVFKASEVRL